MARWKNINGVLQKIAGSVRIDQVLNKLSRNAISNKAVSEKFEEVDTTLDSHQDEIDGLGVQLSDKADASRLGFGVIGDCRGDNSILNSLVQTYCSKLSFGVHFAQVQDNVGTSSIGGGLTSLIILKSDSNYYPVIGFKYIQSAGVGMYVGSIFNGTFTGFTSRYLT